MHNFTVLRDVDFHDFPVSRGHVHDMHCAGLGASGGAIIALPEYLAGPDFCSTSSDAGFALARRPGPALYMRFT
jgi:hypothetical protein